MQLALPSAQVLNLSQGAHEESTLHLPESLNMIFIAPSSQELDDVTGRIVVPFYHQVFALLVGERVLVYEIYDPHLGAKVIRQLGPGWTIPLGEAQLFATRTDLQGVELSAGIQQVIFKGSVPAFAWRMENNFGKTTLSTPDQDSNLDLPIIGGLVYCESDALEYAATEAVAPKDRQVVQYVNLVSSGFLMMARSRFECRPSALRLFFPRDFPLPIEAIACAFTLNSLVPTPLV
uniref:Uncharacterized protein n=1 Tax=Timema tahoe TaxID=61484 RepID=A0A7R9NYX5_9NEOP|nr:unnamed protein product [Timema tahoe]